MKMKFSWKICLAALVGFIAGAALFHSRTVKADLQTDKLGGGIVRIYPTDTSWNTGKFINGAVVGFSCVPASAGGKYTECYLVTQ